MARVVDRNVRALLERRCAEEVSKGAGEKLAAKISAFAGSMRFVVLHLALYGGWIVTNPGTTANIATEKVLDRIEPHTRVE